MNKNMMNLILSVGYGALAVGNLTLGIRDKRWLSVVNGALFFLVSGVYAFLGIRDLRQSKEEDDWDLLV